MFYSARYPKSDWTELSCLPRIEPRPTTKKTLSTVKAGRPCNYIYAASEGRFSSCCSRQSLLRRPMKGQSRACAKMGAHSLARACGGGSYRNRPQLKNTRLRRWPPAARMPQSGGGGGRGLQQRVCLVVFWVPSSMGASFSADQLHRTGQLQYTQGQFDFRLD
jgi:hypothetical protein